MGWLDFFSKYHNVTPYDFSYTTPTKIPSSNNLLPLSFPKQQLTTAVNKNDLTGFDKNQILWNGWINEDRSSGWSARDINGNPLIDNEGKKRIWGLGDSESGSISRGNGRYSHDSKAGDINKLSWYNFITSTYSDENKNPTTHGKNWLKLYVKFSGDDLPFKEQLQKYIDSGFTKWESITRGGNTFHTFGDFAKDVYTRLLGLGHNTDRGILPYYIDENGNRKLFEKGKIDFLNYKQIPANELLEGTNVDLVGYRRTSLLDRLDSETPVSKTPISDTPKDTSLEDVKSKVSEMAITLPDGSWKRKVDETGGDKLSSGNGGNRGPFNPTILDAMRLAADNLFNIRNTNKYKEALRPSLENHSPSYKQVFGDEKAKWQGRQLAARLINRTPLTSNAQLQTASDLEAIAKGNLYIQQGENKDAETYWKISELAFQQAKENTNAWLNVANRNYKSLTDYSNKLAELDYLANKDNMQNIDKFVAELSKRLWDKYDLYEYKKMAAEEKANDLYDKYYGNSGEDLIAQELTTKYTDLSDLIYKTTDPAEKLKLLDQLKAILLQMRMLSSKKEAQLYINYLRRYNPDNWSNTWNSVYGNRFTVDNNNVINGFKSEYALKLREQGIDVDKLLNLFGWTSPLQGNEFDVDGRRAKNGMKFQSGGSFGVSYTSAAGGGNPYLLALLGKGSTSSKKKADYSSSGSSSSKDDDNSKLKDKLLSEIANTLKGIDGLDSDVEILYKELDRFFDIQQYNLNDDPMQFYSTYIKMLNRVNLIKLSAKLFQKSFDLLEKDKALNSPAITNGGKVVVGIANSLEMDVVSVEDYLANRNKYHLLTNGEYLELRRKKPFMAFDDTYLTQITLNGTSLEAIEKYLKEFISGLGRDEESRDMLTRRVGTEGMQGLETLKGLIQGKFTDAETAEIAAALNSLGEYNVSVSSLARQIQLALNSIFAFMPPNMRTLLELYCGGLENSEKAVLGLITKNTNAKLDFKINGFTSLDKTGQLKSGSTKSSGSGSGSGGATEETEDRELLNIIQGVGGEYSRIEINPGTKSLLTVSAVDYMPVNSPDAYNMTSLAQVLGSTRILGISNPKKIYFGDLKLQAENLKDVLYLGTGFSRVLLPIDTEDGSPDFKLFEKFENACQKVRDLGYNPMNLDDEFALKLLAKYLNGTGLYSLVKGDMPDLKKIGIFLVADAKTSSKAGITPSLFVRVDGNADYDLFRQHLGTGEGKNFKEYEIDDKSWYEGIFGDDYDVIYKGTVYIPINNNPLLATTASGNKRKLSNAMYQEQRYQSSKNLQNYNSDNELKQ